MIESYQWHRIFLFILINVSSQWIVNRCYTASCYSSYCLLDMYSMLLQFKKMNYLFSKKIFFELLCQAFLTLHDSSSTTFLLSSANKQGVLLNRGSEKIPKFNKQVVKVNRGLDFEKRC